MLLWSKWKRILLCFLWVCFLEKRSSGQWSGDLVSQWCIVLLYRSVVLVLEVAHNTLFICILVVYCFI